MVKLTQPQIARVKSLTDADDRISAKRIVEDARKKSSPLHALFDWDKERCAQRDLERQARVILYSVRIVVTNEVTTVKAPVYVKDPDMKAGYRAVAALAQSPESARESLVYTLEVASGHLRRALALAEPLGMTNEIDALIASIVGLQRSLKKVA